MADHPGKNVLLVVFDLKEQSSKYGPLYEFLKAHDGWSHYFPAMWLVATDKTPKELGEGIKPLLSLSEKGGGDRYFVARFTEYNGWGPKSLWDWIKKHREELRASEVQ